MKTFFTFPRIIGYSMSLIILILGYYINDIFFNWNRTRGGDVRGGPSLVYYLTISFVILGLIGVVVNIAYFLFKNRQGFILGSLGLVMILMGFLFSLWINLWPLSEDWMLFMMILIVGIVATLMLGSMIVSQHGSRSRLKILLYGGIVLQYIIIYQVMRGLGPTVGIFILQFLLWRFACNIILLVSLAPSDKL